MDLSDLIIFKTVVDEGGIVKASKRLHRVQSNVTTRIKQLEASVGTDLFHRGGHKLVLSKQGAVLLEYAERLLNLADEARSVLNAGAVRGTLKLGALESTTASRLPALLSLFHQRHPEVRITLRTGTNDCLADEVAARRLDAAFIAEPPRAPMLAYAPLFRETLVVVTSPSHPPVRSARDAAGDSVVAFPAGCAYRRVVERWLGNHGLASVRVLELSSYHAIIACVASGAGIALVPESVLDVVRCKSVSRHPLPRKLRHMTTPIVWRSGEESASIVALRTLAQQYANVSSAGA